MISGFKNGKTNLTYSFLFLSFSVNKYVGFTLRQNTLPLANKFIRLMMDSIIYLRTFAMKRNLP